MAVIGSVFKQCLKDAGLWVEFHEYRSSLKDDGMTPFDAQLKAIADFTPRLESLSSSGGISTEEVMMSSPEPEIAGGSSPACCPVEVSPSLSPEELEQLLGRNVSITEAIQWVAKWLACPEEPVAMDAPSLEAYGMYCSYNRNTVRMDEFWDKIFVRLVPSKAQLDKTVKVKVDGQNIMDAISRIEGLVDGK